MGGMWQFGDHGSTAVKKLKEKNQELTERSETLEQKLTRAGEIVQKVQSANSGGDVNAFLHDYLEAAYEAVQEKVDSASVDKDGICQGKALPTVFEGLPCLVRQMESKEGEKVVKKKVLFGVTNSGKKGQLVKVPQALVFSVYMRILTGTNWSVIALTLATGCSIAAMTAMENDFHQIGFGKIEECTKHPWATNLGHINDVQGLGWTGGFFWTGLLTIFAIAAAYCYRKTCFSCCAKPEKK